MADSFFGFDTSLSNLNDDEGGGGPSEDEYDALNDETFGQADDVDWEVEHESLAHQLESSRRHNAMDDADSKLEASLSKLVLDDSDTVHRSASAFSSVWRNDSAFPPAPTIPVLKNVVSVEELERQLRQKQQPQHNFPPQHFMQQRFQQPLQPVILQRPPGLQAPAPLPFPQQPMTSSMNQQMNNMMPQNHMNHMPNQMGQNQNQFMQNSNQQLGFQNSIGQNNMLNQMQNSQNVHSMGQMGNMNQMGPNMNQMGPNMNQMGQNMNQMGQNMNQVMPNGNQFGSNMNQFQHMMGQPRMIAPPPGMMQRQNFSPNMGQYNPNFRGPMPNEQQQPPNMMMNQNMLPQQMQPQQPIKMNQNANTSQSSQVNHSSPGMPMNQLNKNQPQPNRVEQKPQKARTYNNSKMTSQNLVQLIQSTHPMLQYNNSFHNVNHHPLLNNRNNAFNNNFNNQMYNNQRHNGSYNNNLSSVNGESSPVSSESDEYAGLMSSREKQWLINIQMLQLNTGTPYIHDFYYTVFLERQANKEKEGVKEAHKANQQNHPFYSGGVSKPESGAGGHRERHNSARHNSCSEDAPRTYVPAQFENSLGKLQCGSVTAPRKIIDAEVVSAEPNTGRVSRAGSVASLTPTEVPRETKRTKQLLLDIESLYVILLRLEELNDPLAIANALILKEREEKQKQLEAAQLAMDQMDEDSNMFLRNIESVQKRPKQESPKSETVDKRQVVNLAISQKPPAKNLLDEDKEELINKMFAGLLHGDRLQQMLNVRKGRVLISRFVSRAESSHPRLRSLWSRVLRSLTSAARRDHHMDNMPAPFTRYIQSSNGWSAVLECCSMMTEAFDPARTPYALTSRFTLSCICALIEKATTLVSEPNSNERQWYRFLKTVARAMKNTTLNIARPVYPISEAKLQQHLRQLESRTTIEILQRGRTTVEFADLSKQDVMDYLTKYLC